MNKFVSYEKCSKKEQKARNAAKRGSWNGVNPVSRIVPSKKEYKRNPKHKSRMPDCAWGSAFTNRRESFHAGKGEVPCCSTAHPAGNPERYTRTANTLRNLSRLHLLHIFQNSPGPAAGRQYARPERRF